MVNEQTLLEWANGFEMAADEAQDVAAQESSDESAVHAGKAAAFRLVAEFLRSKSK